MHAAWIIGVMVLITALFAFRGALFPQIRLFTSPKRKIIPIIILLLFIVSFFGLLFSTTNGDITIDSYQYHSGTITETINRAYVLQSALVSSSTAIPRSDIISLSSVPVQRSVLLSTMTLSSKTYVLTSHITVQETKNAHHFYKEVYFMLIMVTLMTGCLFLIFLG